MEPEPGQICAPCPQCGFNVTFTPVFRLANCTVAPLCAPCMKAESLDLQRQARNFYIQQRWLKICPERYRDTVLERLPCLEKSNVALAQELTKGKGLNLWGLPDTGKTRTMFLVLKRAHENGKSMAVFSPTKFAAEMERRVYHRAVWISNLARLDLVAFDDMDKLCLTAGMEKLFFGLLDSRMQKHRPCLFTHNSRAEDLQYKFKMGEAMVRRIREFTKSVHFP